MALGIRYNASATLALICCLLHTGLAQHESRLNSVFLEHRLKASKFYVISETVEQFNEARGLQHSNLSWKHDCKPECYQNKGTCNLLTGVCQCPIGRVHSDAGGDCAIDEIADCQLDGFDMPMLLTRYNAGLQAQSLWSAWNDQKSKSLWLGPRSCKCVRAWMNSIGPQAHGNSPILVSCINTSTTLQSMDEVQQMINEGQATNLDNWRYMKHTEPWNLLPVKSHHEDVKYIKSIRPESDCEGTCRYGYCTSYPSILWDDRRQTALHRDGLLHIYQDPSKKLPWPQCDCYPDVAQKRISGECKPGPLPDYKECPDSCSFAGECERGFCSCRPGYWGLDCGLSINDQGEPFAWKGHLFSDSIDMSIADTMPSIYVYDIQPAWTLHMYQTKKFVDAILVSPFRSADPEKAAFFWIPTWQGEASPQVGANIMRYVIQDLPYFNRSIEANFSNHIIANPGDYGLSERLWGLKEGERSPLLETPEVKADSPDRRLISLQYHGRIDGGGVCAGNVESAQRAFFQPGLDIMIPPASDQEDGFANHLMHREDFETFSPVLNKSITVERQHCQSEWITYESILSSLCATRLPGSIKDNECIFSSTISINFNVQELFFSGTIVSSMFTLPNSEDPDQPLSGLTDRSGRAFLYHLHNNASEFLLRNHASQSDKPISLVEGASTSHFCFVPYGQAGGYGGRYVNTMVFGCIPVFFRHSDMCSRGTPLDELPDVSMRNCSLDVDLTEIQHLPDVLKAVSDEQRLQMRECLENMWGRFTYASIFGSFFGEDPRKDAWNGVMTILHNRWIALVEKSPEAAEIILQSTSNLPATSGSVHPPKVPDSPALLEENDGTQIGDKESISSERHHEDPYQWIKDYRRGKWRQNPRVGDMLQD